jgi:TetR/AcrR family transcriptional regulator, regulator of cefoperazone and chloramphenicol sensitivity
LKRAHTGRKVASGAKRARTGGYARGAEARQRIVLAALAVFGAKGFKGASTRVIAQRAGVVLPALQYYFGGKQSLYHECARHIATQISAMLDPALAQIAPLIAPSAETSPRQAKEALYLLLDKVVDMLVGSRQPEAWVMFIVREQANPTTAFELIYEQGIGRIADAFTALVSKALGRSVDDPEVRARGFAVLGQVVAFRAARAAALRSLGWRNFDGERLEILKKALRAHTEAALQ